MRTTRQLLIYLRDHIQDSFKAGNTDIYEVIDGLLMMDLLEEYEYNHLKTYVINNLDIRKSTDLDYLFKWLNKNINKVNINYLVIKYTLIFILTIFVLLLIINRTQLWEIISQ